MGLFGFLTKKSARKRHAKSEQKAQAERTVPPPDQLGQDHLNDTLAPKQAQPEGEPQYSLTKNLGKGAYGKVDRYDAPGQKPVAKKTAFGNGVEELKKESEVLDTLGEHENIVQKSKADVGADGLGLELLQGGNMQDMMDGLEKDYRDGKISHTQYWGSIQHLTKGTLKGVDHMNSKGLVHGDLKPGNVMIDEETAQPKLIDFGSATKIGEDAPQGQTPLVNTTPEVMGSKDHKVHKNNDVYAVGNMAYRMGEGRATSDKDGGKYAHAKANTNFGAMAGRREAFQSGEQAIKDATGKGDYAEFVNALTNPNPDARPTAKQSLDAPFLTDSLLQEHEAQDFLKARIEGKNGAPPPPAPPPPELATTTATKSDHKAKSDMQKELLKATKGTRKELDSDAKERSKEVERTVKAEEKTKKKLAKLAKRKGTDTPSTASDETSRNVD